MEQIVKIEFDIISRDKNINSIQIFYGMRYTIIIRFSDYRHFFLWKIP